MGSGFKMDPEHFTLRQRNNMIGGGEKIILKNYKPI